MGVGLLGNVYKLVLRVEIPELRGESTSGAYEYYQKILGEPDYKDEWEEQINYFEYRKEYRQFYCSDTENWGIDKVLCKGEGEEFVIGLSGEEILRSIKDMVRKFGVSEKEVRLVVFN